MAIALVALVGCGGGGSAPTQQPPPPPPTVTSVTVSPTNIQLQTGQNQLFTAQVTGTGAFSSAVTWSVNGITGGNSTIGTINGGQYTAPSVLPTPSAVVVQATSVQDSSEFNISNVTLYAPASLTSISPPAASAGEQITINGQNLLGPTAVVFAGLNGTSISMPVVQQNSLSQFTAVVPYGATAGPVYVNLTPYQGITETTNSLALTRLPNLLVHAPNKDLSSGETLQFEWRLLGANTPSTVTWTANSGTINAQGLFQAPVVSSESYSRVTGCLQGTNSCNTVLLRILPFRITPPTPIVNIASTIQLDALQGGSLLSPQWSVLAGGGSIATGGMFTAPTIAAQAGSVPVAATAAGTTEETSVAVEGAFAGLVNRIYDYADLTTYRPPEETAVESVAVSGNRAYALTAGNPFSTEPPYVALNVYDITNPDQPAWIDAGEYAANYPAQLYTYGNTLFSIDQEYLVVYSLTTQVPTLTEIVPVVPPQNWNFNNGVLYVNPVPSGLESTTLPVDLYDFTTGTPLHNHYELPEPAGGSGVRGISGNGNIVYVSWLGAIVNNNDEFTVATYDISQSTPALLSTISTTSGTEYNVQVAGNLLLADSQVFDISNEIPVQIATVPLGLGKVQGVQGNNVLASGGRLLGVPQANYAVVNFSSPSNPIVQADVADVMTWNVLNPNTATWATNGRIYTADGVGGIGVYNVSAAGGPASVASVSVFTTTYDQVLEQQTLYDAVTEGGGTGGLACFDVSSGTPNLLGTLLYANDTGFAVQVSGTNVFLGMADSLKVVDVSNPEVPVEVTSVKIPVVALALSGSTLFVGTGDGRLVVFNVSTPASPSQIASLTVPAASTMRLSGTLLLVAGAQNGLLVFDVSHANAPVMLSQFSPTGGLPVWDVVPLGGTIVMLAADASGLIELDLSTPSSPQQILQQQLPFLNAFPVPPTEAGIVSAFSLATQNGLTYVGTSVGVMFTYDATVPEDPRLMGVNVVGEDDVETVTIISPGQSSLYIAINGVAPALLALDNTIPQNSIELYYPPAALSIAVPPDTAPRVRDARNPRAAMISRRSTARTHNPDRFGVAQAAATVQY